MANQQARVTSTEALESFRASLVVFLTKARRTVDDVSDEVRRTRAWLQHDRRSHWEAEFRRRTKLHQQAEQEMFSVRLGAHNQSAYMARQAAVNKAKRDLEDAEAKLRLVRVWNQKYDSTAEPLVKRLENLRQLLDTDMPKAITYLNSVQRTLEAYADTKAPSMGSASASSPETSASTEAPAPSESTEAPPPAEESAPAETPPTAEAPGTAETTETPPNL